MLHEDTSFKSAQKNEGFTLSKPNANAEVHLDFVAPQAPARPVVLEFGGANTAVPKPPTPSSSGTPYTGFNPSLSSAPIASAGSRNVSQIGSSLPPPIPKPPVPPQGAVPLPKPPQPPTPPQKEKVIVKNFL
jgi:hypothetical protein